MATIRRIRFWSVVAMVETICYGVLALSLYINPKTARLLKTLALISGENWANRPGARRLGYEPAP